MMINLGDKYAGGGGQWDKDERPDPHKRRAASGSIPTNGRTYGFGPKSLLGLPWRYALGCVDQLGLILRQDQIWHKVNGLPESVTDRTRRSHEYWFHFVQQPRYYSAVDEIREPHTGNAHPRGANARVQTWTSSNGVRHRTAHSNPEDFNLLGKLPGSVWSIPSEPLVVPDRIAHARCCAGTKRPGCEDGVDHFAAFPLAWPLRLIAGWSPPGICTVCGEGRRPVACVSRTSGEALRPEYGAGNHGTGGSTLGPRGVVATITGYACACPGPAAPTRPSLVVDPFGGTGTTALAARALGRIGITVDRSGDYCRLAAWRTTNPAELAKALRVEKPQPQTDGQATLFEMEAHR